MTEIMRMLRDGLGLACVLAVVSCGGDAPGSASSGGGSVTAASNVVPVIVDAGPTATSTNSSSNTLFTSVTICVPGTTQCQTIDHIQVDTGSSGLRILASALTLALPLTADSNASVPSGYLLECAQFGDGFSWGPIATADLQVSGETASSLPVQVIGDSTFSAIPDACSSANPTSENTVATFGANGLLGIGFFEQDCGSGCATNAANGFYYSCNEAGACVGVEAPLTAQVLNPVPLFATDNNGTIISLPSVASAGAATVSGSLIFGIDSETNNASGSQTVLTVDPSFGYFTTVFAGQSLPDAFIDSGSNATFFNDGSITQCTAVTLPGFYCPASPVALSATLTGQNGESATASFSVGNPETFSGADAALPMLAGTYTADTEGFDWGLPFFYGRRVATAIENHSSAVATGPYVAF